MVFACFVIIAIAALTDIVPLSLQPSFIFLMVAIMIAGGIIGMVGFFKSYDKSAYPVLVVVLLIPLILVLIYYLTRR
ncbi:MAG: hypothetical protein ACFFBL_02010 [Promethearchaeota archaeon]